MACEVCAHCMAPVPRGVATVREGWSYHKKCHKCYVCSETDLHDAEVFKGVIFCSGCSQRIFQGCSTARHAKAKPRRRERRRRDRAPRADADRVIEMARLGRSSTSSDRRRGDSECTPPEVIAPYPSSAKYITRGSAEIGTTTEATTEFLKELNCPVPAPLEHDIIIPIRSSSTSQFEASPSMKHKRQKGVEEINTTGVSRCSDLRIAELGASTEIATMALRMHSGMTFRKSEIRMRPISATSEPSTVSELTRQMDTLNIGSSNSESDVAWTDSACKLYLQQAQGHILNRHLGSLIKLPYKLFKKKILMRSSLISVIMSKETEKEPIFTRMKSFFQEEIVDHHRELKCGVPWLKGPYGRGVKWLYSTINKRNIPYRLGWLESTRRVPKKCKHCRTSHSYRCMREQVMRSAGPTKSEIRVVGNKIKNTILPPFLLKMIEINSKRNTIMMSEACGSERANRPSATRSV